MKFLPLGLTVPDLSMLPKTDLGFSLKKKNPKSDYKKKINLKMLSFVKQLYLMKLIRFLFSRIFYKQLFYILILSVIIVVSLIFYLNHSTFHGKSIVVPNLIGKTINEVDQELNKLTLRYEVIDSARYNSNYKPLSVIDHQPTSNSKVKKNRKIYLRNISVR